VTKTYTPRPRAGTAVFSSFREAPRSPRVPANIVALMMLQVLERKSTDVEGIEDPATQCAIDWMCEKSGTDRRRLFELLAREFEAGDRSIFIFELIMEAWTDNRKLKLATGRTRDEWLSLMS
jgi:hypothetical protein